MYGCGAKRHTHREVCYFQYPYCCGNKGKGEIIFPFLFFFCFYLFSFTWFSSFLHPVHSPTLSLFLYSFYLPFSFTVPVCQAVTLCSCDRIQYPLQRVQPDRLVSLWRPFNRRQTKVVLPFYCTSHCDSKQTSHRKARPCSVCVRFSGMLPYWEHCTLNDA